MQNALVRAPGMVSRLSDYRMVATFPHAVAAVQPSRVRPLILALRPGLL
jgi:hypothetical protein